MLLGFKQQFSPFIEEGSKDHTIRALRKNPPRVGEICHCYEALRTKKTRLLGRWPCTRVQDITIQSVAGSVAIYIDGSMLEPGETEAFLWRDGFRVAGKKATSLAVRFWAKQWKNGREYFRGHLIHWDFNRPVKGFRRKRLQNPKRKRKNA